MKKAGKKWIMPTFDEPDSSTNGKTLKDILKPPSPLKTLVSNNQTTRANKSIPLKKNFNLLDKLAPKTVSDLGVNSKKVEEVERWLKENVSHGNNSGVPMLLLTGPTGSGKTAVVRVLCKTLKLDLVEWVNPISEAWEEDLFEPRSHYALGQTLQLSEFLCESSKFPSLFSVTGDNLNKVTLLEDIPNSVVRNPADFQNVLEKCYNSGHSPIVFICTDDNDNVMNLSQSLFPQDVRDKFGIKCINFNPCASSLLKAALKRSVSIVEKYPDILEVPSEQTLDAIANSVMGDIRNAVNQFQFACLNGYLPLTAIDDQKNGAKKGTKRKRPEKLKYKVTGMIRDETLGLFHGLGRVLNPKRSEDAEGAVQCDYNALVDEFSTRPAIFCNFLHANYPKYFGAFEDVATAAEFLSESQCFLDKWQDRPQIQNYALWVSIMGLMICNKHKVSKWNQIRGPQKINNMVVQKELNSVSPTDYVYYNVINKSKKFPMLKR